MLQFLDLPPEILTLIASLSPKPTQKALRQSHTQLCLASTPSLFHSITIVPHAGSLANAVALSQSPLARHVHSLVYDVRMLSSINDIKMAYEANEFSLVGSAAEINESRTKVFGLLDEYRQQSFFSTQSIPTEMGLLLKMLSKLPNLAHITITSDTHEGLPSFYVRLKESLFIASDYYFEPMNAFEAGCRHRSVLLSLSVLGVKIPRLSLLSVECSSMIFQQHSNVPDGYLHLVATSSPGVLPNGTSPSQAAAKDLGVVCANVLYAVQHLELALATASSERELFLPTGRSFPLSDGADGAQLHYINKILLLNGGAGPSKLRSLKLSSLVTNRIDLEFMLSICQHTLTDLVMGDLRLHSGGEDSTDDKEACWVDVLGVISKNMHALKRVTLFGRFYNGSSQSWMVRSGTKGTFKDDVENWIVHGGVCPLESERIGSRSSKSPVTKADVSFGIFRQARPADDDEVGAGFRPTSENEISDAWQ